MFKEKQHKNTSKDESVRKWFSGLTNPEIEPLA